MAFLPYARLLRLPNVFTAFADIALGVGVTLGLSSQPVDSTFWLRAILLFVASGCLYCAGMVWNDYFDLEEDKRDRPFRPLASGRISLRFAILLGSLLFGIGGAAAAFSGWDGSRWCPMGGILGGVLIVAILLYDARIKRTSFGPIGMAACRFLNVLLGLSLADLAVVPWLTRIHLASTIALYIVGVTWFARTEEKRSNPAVLKKAGIVMLLALLVGLAVGIRVPTGHASVFFPYLLVAFGFFVGRPIWKAIRQPTPAHVQAGVKRSILGLVVLDAVLATVFVGEAGLLIILLLPPALLIGKWVYST